MRIKHEKLKAPIPKNLYMCPECRELWTYIRYKAELLGGDVSNQDILYAALDVFSDVMKDKKKWDFVRIKKVGVL